MKKGGGVCCYISKSLCVSYAEFEAAHMSSKDIGSFGSA